MFQTLKLVLQSLEHKYQSLKLMFQSWKHKFLLEGETISSRGKKYCLEVNIKYLITVWQKYLFWAWTSCFRQISAIHQNFSANSRVHYYFIYYLCRAEHYKISRYEEDNITRDFVFCSFCYAIKRAEEVFQPRLWFRLSWPDCAACTRRHLLRLCYGM